MKISMYQASAPRFAHMLRNLSTLLDKAQAHAEAKKLEPSALTTYRLYPDMFPLIKQVQIAADFARGVSARLAGQGEHSLDGIALVPTELGPPGLADSLARTGAC